MAACPVCLSNATIGPPSRFTLIDCERCGRWSIDESGSGIEWLKAKLGDAGNPVSAHRRSQLSFIIRQRQPSDGRYWGLPLNALESLHLDEALPTPSEQLDRLVLFLGKQQPSPAESAHVKAELVSGTIGTLITPKNNEANLGWLLAQDQTKQLVETRDPTAGGLLLRLNMIGWERYMELQRARVESRRVLMAMKFGDAELDRVVEECFMPAVRRAGFELSSLDRNQPAGLIDDQMRVALRISRFIVADLTHASRGAYWEAGFAEGLGRPVIYTCRKDVWEDERSHFDTNHLRTIPWSIDDLASAGQRLTGMIRSTLPAEAVMTDPA